MNAMIASKYFRSAGHKIVFNVDDQNFKDPNAQRKIVEGNYLDGTYYLVDWGYRNTGARIDIANIRLTRDDYDLLYGMKTDNEHTEFLFHHLDKSWPVMITDVQKTVSSGNNVYASAQLLVTNDPIDTETA